MSDPKPPLLPSHPAWRKPLGDDDPFTTELTPTGEQYVIPGAEKRTTAKKPQGELFG